MTSDAVQTEVDGYDDHDTSDAHEHTPPGGVAAGRESKSNGQKDRCEPVGS